MSGSSVAWFDNGELPHGTGLNPACPQPEVTNFQDGQIRIVGRIHTSGNLPYIGWIQVTAQDTMGNFSRPPRTVITKRPTRFTIPLDGRVDLLLSNSVDSGSLYQFEIGYTTTIPTGAGLVDQDTVTDSFYARVPRSTRVGETIELTDLLPTPLSRDRLDTSVYRVAEAIVTDPTLRAKAVTSIRIAGAYDPLKVYSYGDFVTVTSVSPFQSFICLSRTVTTPAPLPLNPNLWQRVL